MKDGLIVMQVVVSVILTGSILLQSRGSGLGRAWGGAGLQYHSKRGMEKLLFRVTLGLTVVFFGISLASLVV